LKDSYFKAKKNKLIQQFVDRKAALENECSQNGKSVEKIFDGITFHINGYTGIGYVLFSSH